MSLTYIYRIPRFIIRKFVEAIRSLSWNYGLISLHHKHKNKLLKLKNKHKGKPCVIIGGGPSLKKMNINRFKTHITIGCNAFYLLGNKYNFYPDYYTVEDPLPAMDNRDQINSLKKTIKIIPLDLKKIISDGENTIYVNFKRSSIYYKNKNFPLYSDCFEEHSFWGGTVLYFNIQLAQYLGCNPIKLVGVDLDYKIPKNITKNGNVLTSKEDDKNHFDSQYFGKGKKWHLPEVDRMQKAFDKAYQNTRKSNIDLVNSGLAGNLKNIPRDKTFL